MSIVMLLLLFVMMMMLMLLLLRRLLLLLTILQYTSICHHQTPILILLRSVSIDFDTDVVSYYFELISWIRNWYYYLSDYGTGRILCLLLLLFRLFIDRDYFRHNDNFFVIDTSLVLIPTTMVAAAAAADGHTTTSIATLERSYRIRPSAITNTNTNIGTLHTGTNTGNNAESIRSSFVYQMGRAVLVLLLMFVFTVDPSNSSPLDHFKFHHLRYYYVPCPLILFLPMIWMLVILMLLLLLLPLRSVSTASDSIEPSRYYFAICYSCSLSYSIRPSTIINTDTVPICSESIASIGEGRTSTSVVTHQYYYLMMILLSCRSIPSDYSIIW